MIFTPIPKSPLSKRVDEFRPISILSVVAKVLESLVYVQVHRYQHGILHEAQSGFRPKPCTQDVILRIVDDWRCSLENNEIVGAAFTVLTKTFDSISHQKGLVL